MTDEEFKTHVLVSLERIELNQAAHSKTDTAHDGRLTCLEHTVNGNGKTGLAEEVRNLKGRWGFLMAGGLVVVNLLINWMPEFLTKLLTKKAGG